MGVPMMSPSQLIACLLLLFISIELQSVVSFSPAYSIGQKNCRAKLHGMNSPQSNRKSSSFTQIHLSHRSSCMRRYDVTTKASTTPMGDLAVRLDQPILQPEKYVKTSTYLWRSFLAILMSDFFKAACLTFLLGISIALGAMSYDKIYDKTRSITKPILHCYKLIRGRVSRIYDGIFNKATTPVGVPMNFDPSDIQSEGWGVCSLLRKKPVGRSKYIQYDFAFPMPHNTLDLALGQQMTLCVLDSKDNVVKGDFYLHSPRNQLGSCSILVPEVDESDESDAVDSEIGLESGSFVRALQNDLKDGDEIALTPGKLTLNYRGEYLPVNEMVYFTSGLGIVPVIEQVKAVLPSGSSSVKGVSVIWTNKDEEDFDVAMSTLEDEYFKYSTKLAVSCIIDDTKNELSDNNEIEESLQPFSPGTMAVVSGPKSFCDKAQAYLISKDFPDDCICILP